MFELTDENYVKNLHFITLTTYSKLHEQEWKPLNNSSAKIFNEDLFIKSG